MTYQSDCTHLGLANRRCFIAGLACTAILPMAANAQLAGPPTAEDVMFMRMAIEEARLADFPFGAVIVRDGAVMARGRNLVTRTRTGRRTRRRSHWQALRSARCPWLERLPDARGRRRECHACRWSRLVTAPAQCRQDRKKRAITAPANTHR